DPHSEGHEAPRGRALRQLEGQPLQSQPGEDDLPRAHDVGRDDGTIFRRPGRQGHRPEQHHQAREVPEGRRRRVTFAIAVLLFAAQIGGTPVRGGNPTPGTPQPEPPNVAERVTVTGCVERVARDAKPVDGNTVFDSRYVLMTLEQPSKIRYKLAAIESQLSPFAGELVTDL